MVINPVSSAWTRTSRITIGHHSVTRELDHGVIAANRRCHDLDAAVDRRKASLGRREEQVEQRMHRAAEITVG
jgi:hypothetical protein